MPTSTPQPAHAAPRAVDPRALAAVALAGFATHASALTGGFTWHDHGDVVLGRVDAVWGPYGHTGFFRPVVAASVLLDKAAYGAQPWGFHLTNLLLHTLASVAVWLAVPALFGDLGGVRGAPAAPASRRRWDLPRLAVALCFAIHPLSWQPAAVVSYRPESLLVASVLTALAAGSRWLRRGGASAALAALTCGALALGSKETAAAWLPALALPALLQGWRSGAPVVRRRAGVGAAAVAGLLLAYGLSRAAAVPAGWHVAREPLPWPTLVASHLGALADRIPDLAGARLPSLSDATPVRTLAHLAPWLGGLTLVTLALPPLARLNRWAPNGAVPHSALQPQRAATPLGLADHLAAPAWVAWVVLAPSLGVVPLPRWSSPHYLYLAPAVVAALLLALGDWAATRWRTHRALTQGDPTLPRWARVGPVTLALIAAVGWSGVTFAGGQRVADDVSLFAPDVARSPGFREGHQWLGHHYWAVTRDAHRARVHLEAAVAPRPGAVAFVDAASVLFNLAGARVATGDPAGAERLLDTLARQPPRGQAAQVAEMRAVLALRRRDAAKALRVTAPYPDHPRLSALATQARSLRSP